MLIRNVEVDGARVDLRLANGRIAEIGIGLAGDAGFDGRGGALLPGLHDHHIHLNASAAAMNSVRCGPPEVQNAAQLIEALNRPGGGWLRGIGYHHSAAGEIDRDWLDTHGPDRPMRIQHRGGRMWILNTAAMEALEITEPTDGRLVDKDNLIRMKSTYPDLTPLIKKLLSYGITGVTEVTPSNGKSELSHYLENAMPLRVCIMGSAELSGLDNPHIGPLKLHYHDYNLPPLEDLTQEIIAAHEAGRAVAAHCVTRAEIMLILAGIEAAGAHKGDRIEHAAIADEAAIDWMKRLGVTVVTQPNFIQERADAYRQDVPATDHENLWRLGAFARAGLHMAAGSDAPFGDMNPWAAMHAAVNRPAGFDTGEAMTPEQALALYTKRWDNAAGPARRVAAGEPADLCLIDRTWNEARENFLDVRVRQVWVNGAVQN